MLSNRETLLFELGLQSVVVVNSETLCHATVEGLGISVGSVKTAIA